MAKRYVYKSVNNWPVNIGGYRFEEGKELESDVLINGFNEAVSNGFLELTERNPEGAGQDATQAPQTGNTGKVKVIFHMGVDVEGKEVLKKVEIGPNVPVEFPSIDLRENETFEGWFKDAKFDKRVNVDKAKAPKEGEIHFYGKYSPKPEDPHKTPSPDDSTNTNGGAGSTGEDGQVTLPPLPSPPASTPPVGDESGATSSDRLP
jgi:hypothetical protein